MIRLFLFLVFMLVSQFASAQPTAGTPTTTLYVGSGGSTDIVVTTPTHSEGDVLVAFGITGNLTTNLITPPAGWTARLSTTYDHASYDGRLYIWTKVAGASEPASYTFVASNNFILGRVTMVPVSDAADPDTTAPVTTSAIDATSTYTSPAVTTTNDDSLVIRGINTYNSGESFTAPTGHTEIADTGGTYFPTSLATKVYATGSTGTVEWTNTNSWDVATLYTISLSPSAGGGPAINPISSSIPGSSLDPIRTTIP